MGIQEAMSCAGGISSTLFIIQVALQVKVYGLKQWAKLGFGTGVETESHHVEKVIKDAEHDADDLGHVIAHDF